MSWGQIIASDDPAYNTYAQRPADGKPAAEKPEAKNDTTPAPRSEFLADVYSRTASNESTSRLAGMPNMFGDFPEGSGNGVMVSSASGFVTSSTPLAGGARRSKIAENDNSLPQDRIFVMYNHFQDALSVAEYPTVGPGVERSFSVDRYTVGFEKTFGDGRWSFELRMPFTGGFNYESSDFITSAGQFGNLTAVLKRSIYQSDTTAIAVGLGFDTPTGSDDTGTASSGDVRYVVRNQAVHLMPYIGMVRAPNDKFFYQCILQVDVATNGNSVDYTDTLANTSGSFGKLYDQTLGYADVGIGYWLSRNPCATWVTGVAGILELHYTTTVQDAGLVSGNTSGSYFAFGNFSNRVDVLNLTAGLHTELTNNTLCRVAGVVPLRTDDDRLFNAEVQVQLERRF